MENKYKISIGFSKPKTWKPFAWAIQKIEGTEYSHIFITWHCEAINRRKVFEAVGSGVRILNNVVFKEHAKIVKLYNFEVTEEQLFEIEQWAHDQTGMPYGYKAIVGLCIMRAFNAFNRIFKIKGRQGNPFKDGLYSQVCVELGARVLVKLGKKMPIDVENYGLLEFNDLVEQYGQKATQESIDRININ